MKEDFRLGDWIVRPQRHLIERGDQAVHIKPKPMSVLECLAVADGAPVSRDELFDTVWPRADISDETLTKCIAELRKAFGDTAKDSRIIETIPKLGFRLVAPVAPLEEESVPDAMSPVATLQPSGRETAKPVLVLLLLIPALLILALLLFFSGSRSGLKEEAALLSEKAESLSAYQLEQKPGIAVLPFVNMSSDTENEYFSDGMTEELLNALANTNRLPVIARTSSFQFKGATRDVKEIGRLLGVTHVVEGSVRKADGRIRVTAQLIDTVTGMHVWSDVYQRDWSDIFIMQQEITQNIVDEISAALGGDVAILGSHGSESEPMTARRTENLEAYDLYLQGMQMLASTNPLPIERSVGYFDRAIALDTEYADAWAAKGRAIYVLGRECYGHSQIPADIYPDAIAAFRRALQIEPEHAFAMGWLGIALIHNDFNVEEGMRLMKQSIALNPNDAALLSVYGSRMRAMRMEEADEVLGRAFRLDPFGIVPITIRSFDLLAAGRRLDALTLMETSLIEDREGYAPNCYVALLNMAVRRVDAAKEHLQKARQVAHPVDLTLDVIGWMIANNGGKGQPVPWAEIRRRMQTERLSYIILAAYFVKWENEGAMVAAFDLAIEQRHGEMNLALHRTEMPPTMPEADWLRMQEISGVTQSQTRR